MIHKMIKINGKYLDVGKVELKSGKIVEHLKNLEFQWVNGKEPDDDVTFVVINVK